MLNGLDIFSGIGGISVALREWVKPIAYVEIDTYCQGVILSRMADRGLEEAPIWDDIRTLSGHSFREKEIDIIYGGFPCQDISIAGLRKGLEGERSTLFFEVVRLAEQIKPKFIFLENVPHIINKGGDRVLTSVTSLGYDCRWCVISAKAVGALHKRERWFMLAKSNVCHSYSKSSEQANKEAESNTPEQKTRRRYSREPWPFASIDDWQETLSEMDKCSDGISFGVDRVRALGNSVVPQQAKKAFEILMGLF